MENNDALETLMSHPVMTNIKSGRSMDIQAVMAISLNWAYDQSISNNMPLGLSNAIQLANEYRSETNSIAEASNNLLKHEIPKISGFGFLHSLSGNSSLISNIPSVLLLQLRLVNAIAHLAGHDLNDEKVKQLAFASLLGSQISNAARDNLLDGGLKTLLPQITEKFAPKIQGISGFLKYLPAISGIIGSSIDALTTYSIAKAAQSQFLGEIIKQESFCKMQEQRIRLLINMAHIDNELAKKEEILIQKLINNSDLSEEKKSELSTLIPEPIPLKIDFSVFKEEKAYAVNMITSLISIINADGTIHPSERLYLMEIAKEVSVDKEEVTAIIESCHIK